MEIVTKVRWCLWNAKQLTASQFYKETGIEPNEYFRFNKKECIKIWRQLMDKRKQLINQKRNESIKIAKAKLRGDYCACKEEDKKESNAILAKNTKNKQPVRLWYCPAHGNTSSNLGRYLTLQSN